MDDLSDAQLKKLSETAYAVRQDVICMLAEAGSGHLAGSLGITDVMVALYVHIARHDPKNPAWEDRDRIILSNGHVCPAQYAVMAHAGYFPREELMTLRKLGSRLQGHPHRLSLPGLETTSGPLGCGMAQAIGMALAARMDRKSWRVFCITSDGEHDEGNTWESIALAAKCGLENLTVFIDRNGIQIDGRTEDVLPLGSLMEKYAVFGWAVKEIDGHDMSEIVDVTSRTERQKPLCIIARTVPGKGIATIENDYKWHGTVPKNMDEMENFLQQLKQAYNY